MIDLEYEVTITAMFIQSVYRSNYIHKRLGILICFFLVTTVE